jgi:hypothetical protein
MIPFQPLTALRLIELAGHPRRPLSPWFRKVDARFRQRGIEPESGSLF